MGMWFDIIEQMCSVSAGTIKKECALTYDVSRGKKEQELFSFIKRK